MTQIYLNGLNSRELDLIPLTKDIPSANPKLYYVDIPGRNGKLDVTKYMGDVKYENIIIKVTFESFNIDEIGLRQTLNTYNGQEIVLGIKESSNTHTEQYTGRMNAYTLKRNNATTLITITCDVSPEVEYVAN